MSSKQKSIKPAEPKKPNRRELTNRYVEKSLKPAETGTRAFVWDRLAPLAIRSTDNGYHSYGIVARIGGSRNPAWRAIGDVRGVTLAKARQTAREWMEQVRAGKDPRREKERQRRIEIEKQANTFRAVAEAF